MACKQKILPNSRTTTEAGDLDLSAVGLFSVLPLFIQPAAPVTAAPRYLWIQTGIGPGNDFQVWFEDGLTP